MICGVGHRRGSDLALLCLWHRPAAIAPIRLLAPEPPYAASVSLKRRKKKKQKTQNTKKTKLPVGFQGRVFRGKIWGEGCWVCDLLLTGWWWGDRVVFQESCASQKLIILHLGGGVWVPPELRDIFMCISWGQTRTLLYYCTIASWLFFLCFCIPSLP